ncbi:HNH endonuclease [Blastococcus saxobsidens]|uniref:HNH endonuclease n=1 Tax=Blastococcus saxobsidens TaxID=138336 RepID=UPI000CEBAB6E
MTATTHGRKGRPWRRLREQVLREEPVCYLCGRRPSTTVDHVLPLSLFPHLAHVRSNLRGACRPCNGSKHNRLVTAPRRRPAAVTQLKW